MEIVLIITLFTLNIINTFLHSIGTYLLLRVSKYGIETSQIVYLVNLSISEALMNALEALRRIPDLIEITGTSKEIILEIQKYLLIIMFTGISFVYYLNMIYLTFDRLMEILLHIRYPVFWNETKARWLLTATWITGGTLSTIISFLHRFINYAWEDAFFKYFYPILEFTFIIVATLTYSFLFYKYKETRSLPGPCGARQSVSCIRTFRQSRFYQ